MCARKSSGREPGVPAGGLSVLFRGKFTVIVNSGAMNTGVHVSF